MANIESAIKEQRKTKKRTIANRKVKSNVKELIKNSRKEIAASASSDFGELSRTADAKGKTADLVRQACKALDKAAQKGVIKKNAAARKKSRLMKMLNKTK